MWSCPLVYLSCLLLHWLFLLPPLLSTLACHWQPVCPSPGFALAKCGAGTTVYSQHFPATINNKAPSAGRVERVFVIVGSTKDPPCFHCLMSVAPCTCRSNIHGREAAVTVKDLSPEPVPTHSALLFLSLWNLVLRPPWEAAALLSMSSV